MAGFKVLVSWLTNGGKCKIDIPHLDSYSTKGDIPSLLTSYELGEMATILNPRDNWMMNAEEFEVHLGKLNQTKRAILAEMLWEVATPSKEHTTKLESRLHRSSNLRLSSSCK